MDSILPFERRLPRLSRAEQLHRLALAIRPIECKRQQVVAAPGLPPAQRIRHLGRLEREAARAGLGEFHGALDWLCREFCRRSPAGRHPRFDTELLSEEVKLMVHARLPQFDPERGHFGPWLKVYVLLPVYKRLWSEIDADWGRRAPRTHGGRVRRWLKQWALAPLSLDAPVGSSHENGDPPALGETVASSGGPESQVLEDQCRENFLRALERLAEAERMLIERVHLRGERQQEVARSVGLTPGRVSQKLKRAAERLAKTLGDSFEDECGGTAFCRGLPESEGRSAAGSRQAPGTEAQAVFERALPGMVRRSGWQGLGSTPPEPATGLEGELLDVLLAGPTQAGPATGSGALRVASLATGAVAAAWALFVFVPSELSPTLYAPGGQVPQPAVGDSRPAASGRTNPASPSDADERSRVSPAMPPGPINKPNPAGEVVKKVRPAPRVEDNGSPPTAETRPGARKVVRLPSRVPPAGEARTLPDEVRKQDISPALSSGAQSLCTALTAVAPVPPGLEGFAVVEATLEADGALIEGDEFQVLVSGGESVDRFVLHSLRLVASELGERTGKDVARTARYRVALEAEQQRWGCQEATQDSVEDAPVGTGDK